MGTTLVLVRDPPLRGLVPPGRGWRVVHDPAPEHVAEAADVLVLVAASRLQEVAAFVLEARRLRRLRALLVDADVDPRWVVPLLDVAGLGAERRVLVHVGPAVPQRIFGAWKAGTPSDRIADACIVGDRLVVVTCAMERLAVSLGRLPTISAAERARLTVCEDGRRVVWGEHGLDLAAIRAPRPVPECLGSAVARLRTRAGLTQEDVPGVSARQLRRIEAGGALTRAALGRLAAAHGTDPAGYLAALRALPAE